jgi:hypothetical protein
MFSAEDQMSLFERPRCVINIFAALSAIAGKTKHFPGNVIAGRYSEL